MPELAAVYGLGFIFCLVLTMLYVFLRQRRRHAPAVRTLQANLRKIGLYWSDHQDAVVKWDDDASLAEQKRSQMAIGYTGLILSLLSWGGAFFLLIIMLSERFFARSRRERRLFASDLTKRSDFSEIDVQKEIERLDVCNESPAEAASPI